MENENQDVNQEEVASSTPSNQEVQQEQVNPPAEETLSSETSSDSQEQQQPAVTPEILDERGVPYKNVAAEWKRKHEDLTQTLPQMIESAIAKAIQNQPKQQQSQQVPEYTVEQLEQFAQQNPNHRPWVEQEKFKLLVKAAGQIVDAKTAEQDKQFQTHQAKQQAETYVANAYPELFVKDNSGKIVSWQQNHPMTRTIVEILQDPSFANNPNGMAMAADIAYARYARSQAGKTTQTTQQLKTQVKTLQQKTMIEGKGKTPTQEGSSYSKAMDRLKKTGNKDDADTVIKEYLRATGHYNT